MGRRKPYLGLLAVLALFAPAFGQKSFVTFETGPVRPLALSPDGTRLFVANTPDDHLEIFDVTTDGLSHVGAVPVGLEPVAVAARTNDEVWVVNHLSDSVSIVDVPSRRVVRTLLVGDEPRDLVFAGAAKGRAFITTAHRGQQRTHPSLAGVPGAGDPELTTPSVPRADVWVFDVAKLDGGGTAQTLGGVPLAIVALFGDTPRALAATPDGKKVYAAVFQSGNRTAVVGEPNVCDGFDPKTPCLALAGLMPGGNPGPPINHADARAAEVGLIVQQDPGSKQWLDELGRDWSQGIRFDLPDKDVFEIDADFTPVTENRLGVDLGPAAAADVTFAGRSIAARATALGQMVALRLGSNQPKSFAGVGTILFNMVVNPMNGRVYVSNSQARNDVRFEGPGTFVTDSAAKAPGVPPTVQGRLHEMRITVLDGDAVLPRHLNKHLVNAGGQYDRPAAPDAKQHSLSIPLDMAVSRDGKTLYVAAFGSKKIGVFDTARLENDTFDPASESASYIPLCAGSPGDLVCGGGPAGLALDEHRGRLYVLTRFDNAVSVVDLATKSESQRVTLADPEPAKVVNGRPFLYDAQFSSSNGEASCAGCHVFGDFDSLAWDLGDPDSDVLPNPIPINLEVGANLVLSPINGTGDSHEFNPMKGPMTTQTLRGMVNGGSMHWRGDRTGGNDPGGSPFDSEAAFKKFHVAFDGLLGRAQPVTEQSAEMQQFTDFILEVTLPPNPVRALDNSLTADQKGGRDFFFGEGLQKQLLGQPRRSDGVPFDFGAAEPLGFTCDGCHTLNPAEGHFATAGRASFESETQIVKIPHLRNAYQKIGMFGLPPTFLIMPGDHRHMGDQVRGTGFLHDGAVDTLFRFFSAVVFANTGLVGFETDIQRRQMEQFVLAFDSDLAPVVGQQVTLSQTSCDDVRKRIDLLLARANTRFDSKILGTNSQGCDPAAKQCVTECDLVLKGAVGGTPRGWLHVGGTDFVGDDGVMIADATLRLLALVPGQELTYTCLPPGSGQRWFKPRP